MMAIIDKMSSVWLYWLLESVYSFPLRLVVLKLKEPALAKMALIGMCFQDVVSRWDEWSLYTASFERSKVFERATCSTEKPLFKRRAARRAWNSNPGFFIFDYCFFWSGIACGSFGLGSSGFLFLGSPVPLGLWEAPWPIACRLRGQDPLLILALGDLQWAWGPFCS